MIRCRDCEKTIGWNEAIDENYTKISFDFDGLCYDCKEILKNGIYPKASE